MTVWREKVHIKMLLHSVCVCVLVCVRFKHTMMSLSLEAVEEDLGCRQQDLTWAYFLSLTAGHMASAWARDSGMR